MTVFKAGGANLNFLPFFSSSLLPLVINSTDKIVVYDLPSIQDDYGKHNVKVTFSTNQAWLKYLEITNQLEILVEKVEAGNQTIEIKLTDQKGASRRYPLLISVTSRVNNNANAQNQSAIS